MRGGKRETETERERERERGGGGGGTLAKAKRMMCSRWSDHQTICIT